MRVVREKPNPKAAQVKFSSTGGPRDARPHRWPKRNPTLRRPKRSPAPWWPKVSTTLWMAQEKLSPTSGPRKSQPRLAQEKPNPKVAQVKFSPPTGGPRDARPHKWTKRNPTLRLPRRIPAL